MFALIQAIGAVLVAAAIVGGAFIGLGAAIRRIAGYGPVAAGIDLLAAFWMGFAACIAFLQLWHFAIPINAASLAITLGAGWAGLAWNGRAVFGCIRAAARVRPLLIPTIAASCLWIADRAIGPGDAHDSGLYHFPVIRWANEYPVVPGLGNLATTFALNNSSLLYTAMLNAAPGVWHERANHLANAVLLMALFAQVIGAGFAFLWPVPRRSPPTPAARERAPSAVHLFDLCMLPVVAMLGVAKDASSPKTDLPTGILVIVVGSLLWRLLWRVRASVADADRPRDNAYAVLSIATLCAAAVCLKLGAAPFTLPVWLLAVGLWLWRGRANQTRLAVRTAALAVAFSTLLIGPWIGRNIVMSGYPLYPSTAMPVDVEWRVPEDRVAELNKVIRVHVKGELALWLYPKANDIGFLRWYAPLMEPPFDDRMDIVGWEWVRPWLFTLPISSPVEIVMPIGAAFLTLLFVLGMRARGRERVAPLGLAGWMFAPVLLSLVAWFLTAPGPRYGWPMAWLLASASIAGVLAVFAPEPGIRLRRILAAAIVAACVVPLAYRIVTVSILDREGSPLAQVPFRGPGSDHGFHPTPSQEMKQVVTRWGTKVWVPAAEPGLCWNAPLPCVGWPPLDLDLRARDPANPGRGFVIDGSTSSRGAGRGSP